MKYKGSCHCGKVAFEVEGEFKETTACNCSMCSRKGSLLWFVPRQQLHLLTSDDAIGTYTFNKHIQASLLPDVWHPSVSLAITAPSTAVVFRIKFPMLPPLINIWAS